LFLSIGNFRRTDAEGEAASEIGRAKQTAKNKPDGKSQGRPSTSKPQICPAPSPAKSKFEKNFDKRLEKQRHLIFTGFKNNAVYRTESLGVIKKREQEAR
jgi:hypothetical protein